MRARTLTLAVALLVGLAAAQAGRRNLQDLILPGVPMPNIRKDVRDLQGFPPMPSETHNRVQVLVFFRMAGEDDVRYAIPFLAQMRSRNSEDDVFAMGIASAASEWDAWSLEDPFVREWLDTRGYGQLRVVRDIDSLLAPRVRVRTARGWRSGLPVLVVADCTGLVVYTAFLDRYDEVQKAYDVVDLAVARKQVREREGVDPAAQAAVAALDAGKLGRAMQMASDLLLDSQAPPAARDDAVTIVFLLQVRAETELGRVESLLEEGRVLKAEDLLRELRDSYSGTRYADQARDRMDAIDADTELQEERKADRRVSRILEDLEEQDRVEGYRARSFARRLQSAADAYPGTRSAQRARETAAELLGEKRADEDALEPPESEE